MPHPSSPGRSLPALRAAAVHLGLALGLALLVALPARAADVPAAPGPTAAEQAELADGDIVVRVQDDGWTVAFVDVAAPREAVLDAVLDYAARSGDVGSIKGVDVYRDEPGTQGVRWELSIAGMSVVFHTVYAIDRAAGRAVYVIDETRDNDIVDTRGAYTVIPLDDGRSRLVYQARSDSGRSTPEWVRKMLTQRSSRAMLGGMRDRAQGG